ncbi:dihydrolipoamide acetyltransferase family protein [Variovorax sp. YR216]|uniref:dihydrolipoamide acetyltransferase family protein n=1 Tax=Variovorax sp. YR216 TaxID=1882828 RepID=UPI00089636AF|nr:dihydrolipoamide acetyltransferase family protein [Variovorax sp. YR216]SEB25780.1 branched-chain alpha-keto acid dehydrogenase E2 component [Variovorax sp. YR216]
MSGSIHVIKVPDVGEGIAEVELVAWHVEPGDAVVEDQGLADVMTDKANVEIPSPVAGRVIALGGEVGQILAVGSELIRIERSRDDAGAPAPTRAASPPPPVERVAVPNAPATASARPAPSSTRAAEDRPIASPAVRRRAWELGVDLKDVVPSGTAGRIVHADLDAHFAAHGGRPADRAPGAANAERDDEQAIPVIGLRRRIALQMQESKRRIPHFSYVEEVDVTELEALRSALNAKWTSERGRLTLLPLLMRATVLAVREFPQINARFDDEAGVVTRHGAVHIGVATQTPNGLVVPVVRHVEARDLWAVAAEMARLVDAARAGRATRAELSGSTITLSSLGALGGIASTPVINRPEVAIVAVNRIVDRPVLRGGAIVSRRMMNLSSSFDHRVVDGMDAARFVQAMRAFIETPALLFVE